MIADHLILALSWIVYCALHSVLAAVSFKKKMERRMKSGYRYYRIIYVVFAFLSLVPVIYLQVVVPTIRLYPAVGIVNIAGWVIAASGLILMLVCIRKYFMILSGLRRIRNEENSSQLIITGVHRYVRHPLYLGTFLFIWGLLLIFPYLSFLIANTIITGYTLIGIKLEEKKLVDEFGAQYEQYRQKVPSLWPSGIPGRKIH